MIARLLALLRDCRGVAALEFGLLLPAMVSALVGAVETFRAVQAYGKAVSAVQTVADLTARADSQSAAAMAAIATAAQRVMDPLPTTPQSMGIHVASVAFGAAGSTTTQWSFTWGSGAVPVPLSKASGLGKQGESVVMVSFHYAYLPLLRDVLGPLSFNETAVARPRVTRVIPYTG